MSGIQQRVFDGKDGSKKRLFFFFCAAESKIKKPEVEDDEGDIKRIQNRIQHNEGLQQSKWRSRL